MEMDMTYDQAEHWYQNVASNLQRAGVKIRLHKCYPDVDDAKQAFALCCADDLDGKPLP